MVSVLGLKHFETSLDTKNLTAVCTRQVIVLVFKLKISVFYRTLDAPRSGSKC